MKPRTLWMLAITGAFWTPVIAQQYVYPAKGQSAQQQKNDEAACYNWAVQQTGFDPAKPPPAQAAAAPPTTPTGTTPGAGVRGAARGAVVGEVVGGDASTGAAWVRLRREARASGRMPLRQGRHSSNSRLPSNSSSRHSARRVPPASKAAATP